MTKHIVLIAALAAVAPALILVDGVAQAQTSGMERRGDRRDNRQDARDDKRACKAGDEKSRPECRQEKRDDKQEGRGGDDEESGG